MTQPNFTVPAAFGTASPLGGKLAFSIAELSAASSICRTSIYQAVKEGRLRVRKVGKRTVVLVEDARAWLAGEGVDAAA